MLYTIYKRDWWVVHEHDTNKDRRRAWNYQDLKRLNSNRKEGNYIITKIIMYI